MAQPGVGGEEKTVKISTTRFGTVNAPPETLIVLPQGLIGFPLLTRFAVIEPDQAGWFRWWQAVDAPETAFVVVDPVHVVPDYDLSGVEQDLVDLGLGDTEPRQVAALVTVPRPSLAFVTVNLAAPIVVNAVTRQGRQVVLPDGRYPVAARFDEASVRPPLELAA